MPDYPKRPHFFAFKFCRLLAKVCAANEIGPETCWLLTVVAQCEDAKQYTSPVTYFNDQLRPLVGAGSVDSLDRIRRKAINAGWLDYTPGAKGKAGSYFVKIPPQFCGIKDGVFDENPSEYVPQICGHKPEESAEESRRKVRKKAGGKPEESAEHSSLSQDNQESPSLPPGTNGGGAGWDAVALLLGKNNIVKKRIRPTDKRVDPALILAGIKIWKQHKDHMTWDNPEALLLEWITNAVPGQDPGEGWPRRRC